jgi:hypothetical protein
VVAPDGNHLATDLGTQWQAVVAESALVALRSACESLDLLIVSDALPEGGLGVLRALKHRSGPAIPAIVIGRSWTPDFVEAAV